MDKHICKTLFNHMVTQDTVPLVEEEFQEARRSFLKTTLSASASAATVAALGITMSPNAFAKSAKVGTGRANHYYIPASDKTVHWGFFSKSLKPSAIPAHGLTVLILNTFYFSQSH